MQPIRQGDVLLLPVRKITGKKLPHLTLVEGEVTGHAHRISRGKAELYQENGVMYLQVSSQQALLSHEEHDALKIPHGNWMIRVQREYAPPKRRSLSPKSTQQDAELRNSLSTQAPKPSAKADMPDYGVDEKSGWGDLVQELEAASEQSLLASIWQFMSIKDISPEPPTFQRKAGGDLLRERPPQAPPEQPRNWRSVID